jgi:hypothetical protein
VTNANDGTDMENWTLSQTEEQESYIERQGSLSYDPNKGKRS